MKRLMLALVVLLLLAMLAGCKPATIEEVLSPGDVTLQVGQTLHNLPDQVEVVYSNGKREWAGIEQWLTHQGQQFWKDTTISGKVVGTDLQATLRVIVNDENALRLTKTELSSPDLVSAMEAKLRSNPKVTAYSFSPDLGAVCYALSANPEVPDIQSVYYWKVGNIASQMVPVYGGSYYEMEWSADGNYLYAASSTDPVTIFEVFDMNTLEHKTDVVSLMSARWSPEGSELLIAQPNPAVQLVVWIGDGCSYDLAIYDPDADKTTILLPGTTDSIYTIAGWDGPDTVIYNREFVEDGRVERDLELKIPR